MLVSPGNCFSSDHRDLCNVAGQAGSRQGISGEEHLVDNLWSDRSNCWYLCKFG